MAATIGLGDAGLTLLMELHALSTLDVSCQDANLLNPALLVLDVTIPYLLEFDDVPSH